LIIIGLIEDKWRIYKSKMYTHAQCYNVVYYVTDRTRDYIFRKEKKKKNATSYARHCTVVVELERQQQLLLVAVALVD
jgi:hypothetical protein